MKKIFIKTILCTTIIVSVLGGSIQAKAVENTTNDFTEVNEQAITELTEEERLAGEEKMKLAEEYAKNRSKLRGYGTIKTLTRYQTAVQQQGNWCGPATAYNATNGVRTQKAYSIDLLTDMYGSTPFPGTWAYVMNTDKPGNNYTAIWASNYSDWRSTLKNSIIYTIDKGYPVIADCRITTDTSTHIHPGYSYATNTYHYVAVVGYDDRADIIPAEVLIVDSNTHPNLPIKYWTTVDKLKEATREFGIVW